MPDVFSKEKRSDVMSRIRGRGNRDTELALVRLLRERRISGWRRHQPLCGKPDFVFRKQRVAVFVDGCFWHGCPRHATMPVNNAEFWSRKLIGNRKRDRQTTLTLKSLHWRVIRVWEHELAAQPDRCIRRIVAQLAHSETQMPR